MDNDNRTSEHPKLLEHFPYGKYSRPRAVQVQGLAHIEDSNGSAVIEGPTGVGKTALGVTFLNEGHAKGESELVYVVPTKTLVQQVLELHLDFKAAYGRHEYDCLYYQSQYKADEIPCLLLKDCPHRVDQDTGETHEPGAERCPYYQAKFEAKKGKVVQTMSFYLFNRLFSKEDPAPDRLVIDEAHRTAEIFRSSLSHEITDYHLQQSIDLLKSIGAEKEFEQLRRFKRRMIAMIKRRPARKPELLKEAELVELMNLLEPIDGKALFKQVSQAVRDGLIDRFEKREALKAVQTLAYDLKRYLINLGYSIETDKRHALRYTYAFYVEELPENKRVQYKLVIKPYYVAGLIRRLLAPKTVAMSATIGKPSIFGFETGIDLPFISLPSTFPKKNTRLFLPTDIADLSYNHRPKQEPNRTLRRMLRAVKLFAGHGYRSLVVVVSNAELSKIISFAEEEGVRAISYGNGVLAKEAVEHFKAGNGDALFGTEAHYSEGIDLPKQTAPIIFVLRPGYPSPDDPQARFEERRFSTAKVMSIRQWRVIMKALQVRGRNIRGVGDLGVCFFMSRQHRKLFPGGLPEYLQQSFVGNKSFDSCVMETLAMLADQAGQ